MRIPTLEPPGYYPVNMLLLALVAGTGALRFDAYTIPGLNVTAVGNLTGDRIANFRTLRIDADPQPDILFADRVLFASESGFAERPGSRTPFADWAAEIDTYNRDVYVRTDNALAVFRFEGSRWTTVAQHAVAWPHNPDREMRDAAPPAVPVFRRFLYPLEDSEEPLVAVPYFDGLHLFQINAEGYREWPSLPIFPEPLYTPEMPSGGPDEPPLAAAWRYRMLLEPERVTVWAYNYQWANRVHYQVRSYRLERTDGPLRARPLNITPLPTLPAGLEPLALNNDEQYDFAAGASEPAQGGLIPVPAFVTRVSTDGGHTIQRFETRGWRPNSAFADINGDQRLDIVTETAGLLRSGPRETLNRWLTLLRLPHKIAVHLQQDNGHFPEKPDITHETLIRLPSPPIRNDEFFHRYRWGELISLVGDYNGDGKRDLAIQTRPSRIEIRLNTGNGFEKVPLEIDVPPMSVFVPYDVDGDGRSDLVLSAQTAGKPPDATITNVLLSREGI